MRLGLDEFEVDISDSWCEACVGCAIEEDAEGLCGFWGEVEGDIVDVAGDEFIGKGGGGAAGELLGVFEGFGTVVEGELD